MRKNPKKTIFCGKNAQIPRKTVCEIGKVACKNARN